MRLTKEFSILGWVVALLVGLAALWTVSKAPQAPPKPAIPSSDARTSITRQDPADSASTKIFAHNLRLHQGPSFRVYVQWLRGQLIASRKGTVPSFDDTESFYLNVTNGVIRANIGDVCNFLNANVRNSPLRDIRISGTGNKVTITGKLHRLFTIPVELTGMLQPVAGNRVQMRCTKINVLKIPFRRMLGGLNLTLASFVKSGPLKGIQVEGNDIYFEPASLLPAPHIRGTLTSVSVTGPDLQAVYGDTTQDVERVTQWRNFLRLRNGSLSFGKLTMDNADLMMIDISNDAWFDLDLANYPAQLVNGYTRMTPQAGLQIFMPDLASLKPSRPNDASIEWFKNRNTPPPDEVQPQK